MAKLKIDTEDGKVITLDVGDAPESDYQRLADKALSDYERSGTYESSKATATSQLRSTVTDKTASRATPYIQKLGSGTLESFVPELPSGDMVLGALRAVTPTAVAGQRGISKLAQEAGETVGASVRGSTERLRDKAGLLKFLPGVAGPLGAADLFSDTLTPKGAQEMLGFEGLGAALGGLSQGARALISRSFKAKDIPLPKELPTKTVHLEGIDAPTIPNTLSVGRLRSGEVVYVPEKQLLRYKELRATLPHKDDPNAIKAMDELIKSKHSEMENFSAMELSSRYPGIMERIPNLKAEIKRLIDNTVEEAINWETIGSRAQSIVDRPNAQAIPPLSEVTIAKPTPPEATALSEAINPPGKLTVKEPHDLGFPVEKINNPLYFKKRKPLFPGEKELPPPEVLPRPKDYIDEEWDKIVKGPKEVKRQKGNRENK